MNVTKSFADRRENAYLEGFIEGSYEVVEELQKLGEAELGSRLEYTGN